MNKTAFSPLLLTPTGPTHPAHNLSVFFRDVAGYEIKEMPLVMLALNKREGVGIAACGYQSTLLPFRNTMHVPAPSISCFLSHYGGGNTYHALGV